MKAQRHYLPSLRGAIGLALGLLALWGNPPARAWGSQGHQVVARLAEQQLTPGARAAVQRLLSLEPEAKLWTIANWADTTRGLENGRWHYVNLPRGNCQYNAERDCPQGQCVVAAIERQSAVLASPASDDERLIALKYVVHFMADIHQPLHAGHEDDRGGNRYQLQAFMAGTNLHALWDTAMVRHIDPDVTSLTQRLHEAGDRLLVGMALHTPAAEMAQESCRIVGSAGFYPERQVGMDYMEKFAPVVEQRLALAGARLAALLNHLLDRP